MIQLLEPVPSEDMRTEALYIALIISLTNEASPENRNINKAGLMFAWLKSHNLKYSTERAELLSDLNLDSYCIMIEAIFEYMYVSDFEVSLINPLAKLWLRNAEDIDILEKYLKRWLLLTSAIEDNPESKTVMYQGVELPIALSVTQLRLSAVSISIISLRPDNDMIDELALCYSTEERSTERRIQNSTWNPKYMYKNLGVLFRWGYTEKILNKLSEIARKTDIDLLKQGVVDIAQLLCVKELPSALEKERKEHPDYYFETKSERLSRGERIFNDDKPENVHHINGCAEFALRTDFPSLHSQDKALIQKYFQELVVSEKFTMISTNRQGIRLLMNYCHG